jgi:outer membrane protein assembly factor BamB
MDLSDRSLDEVDLGGCVESSPTVVGDQVFVGASKNAEDEIYHLSIDPFEIVDQAHFGEECRATIACDLLHLYFGVDTGHTFHSLWPDTLLEATDAFADPWSPDYFVGSAAVTYGHLYVGNDNGILYMLSTSDLSEVFSYDDYYDPNFDSKMCSSPAVSYNVDQAHNRWVFITTRADGGRLLAFKESQ